MATSQPLSFGALLKRLRRLAGLTQEQLAERAGYSAVYISKVERGDRLPLAPAVELLADALALTPDQRAAFLAAAGQGRQSSASSHRPVRSLAPVKVQTLPTLIGRADELANIERLLGDDGPPVLMLAGEPGIGKTRLLRETINRAAVLGWCVLADGCHRRSGQEAYAPIVGALARYVAGRTSLQQRHDLAGCAWLVRLLPELAETAVVPAPAGTLAAGQERRLLFAAVARYLGNVAGPAGTLLVLDDLQWAGEDALALLATLTRAQDESSLRIIGAYRSTEVRPGSPLANLLADLAREGLVEQGALSPLRSEEAKTLLTNLAQAAGAAWNEEVSEQVARLTGGVPYFLVSCAQSLQGDAGQREIVEAIPWNVSESIRQRVAALPEATQQLMRLAAVVGREVEAALLFDVAGRWGWPKSQVLAALEATDQARLLVEADGAQWYAFAHDLIREVLVDDLSTGRRVDLHLQVAELLEAMPHQMREPRITELAWHFLEAHEQARALPYALQAGDQAEAAFAHAEAERYYRTALQVAQKVGDQRREAEALEKVTTVLGLMTRYDEAIAAGEYTLALYHALGNVEGEGRAVWLIGLMYHEMNRSGLALARLEPLVQDLARRGLSVANQARLWSGLAMLRFFRGKSGEAKAAALTDYHQALTLAEKGVNLARIAKDDAPLGWALFTRGISLNLLGHYDDAVRDFDAAVPLVEAAGGEVWIASNALANAQGNYLWWGEFGTSLAYSERAIALADRIADPFALAICWGSHGEIAFALGDWSRARADFTRAQAALSTMGREMTIAGPSVDMGLLCLAEGDWETAAALLTEALVVAERQQDLQLLRIAHGRLAEHDLLEGFPAAARGRLEPLLDRPGLQEGRTQHVLSQLAWAYMELGEEQRAGALLAESHARAIAHRHRYFLVDALRVQAMLRMRQAQWQEAVTALEETLALCRGMPYPYAEAKALYVYGLLNATKGELEKAREKYVAAIAICERLGEGLYRPHIERALTKLDRN